MTTTEPEAPTVNQGLYRALPIASPTADRIGRRLPEHASIEETHRNADGGNMTDTKQPVTYSLTKESPYELRLYLVQAIAAITGLSVATYFLL